MNILLNLGDAHLRAESFYQKGIENFMSWFDEKIPSNKKDCTEIFLSGDVFDKIYLLPETSALACRYFELLHSKAHRIYAILGNHDYGLHKYKVKSAYSFLKKLGVEVITEPGEYVTTGGFKVLCLPWRPDLSFTKINNFIAENCEGKHYDAVVSHWEIESLFGSGFININKVDASAYCCGHIHQHNNNPKYLGSLLPNSIAELKEKDQSVIRMLLKKDDNTDIITKDFLIPSFVSIKKVVLSSLTELDALKDQGDRNTFYKIVYKSNLKRADIESMSRLIGLQLYGVESEESDEDNFIVSQDVEFSDDIDLKEAQSHMDIFNEYKDCFNLTDEEYELAKKIIEEVA